MTELKILVNNYLNWVSETGRSLDLQPFARHEAALIAETQVAEEYILKGYSVEQTNEILNSNWKTTEYNEKLICELKQMLYDYAYSNATEDIKNPDALDERLKEIKKLYRAVDTTQAKMTLDEIFTEDEDEKSFTWFSEGLNTYYEGFKAGEMYGIVCCSGAGKTTYLMQQAVKSLQEGYKVCYIFSEMKAKDVNKGLLSAISHIKRRKLTDKKMILKEHMELFDNLDIRRIKPYEFLETEILQDIIKETDADVILLDYLKIEGGDGAFEHQKAVRDYLSNVKTVVEDEKKAFIFAMQANKPYLFPKERQNAAQFVTGCHLAHESCDGFICVSKITGSEMDQTVYDVHNIRCITIIKNRFMRHNDRGYEEASVYEQYNPETISTETVISIDPWGETEADEGKFLDGVARDGEHKEVKRKSLV